MRLFLRLNLFYGVLAMAFSLAGVVAGVRYRYALKSTADSLFIFMAVGVGLSCGVGMLLVAAVMSAIFNYTFPDTVGTELRQHWPFKNLYAPEST